MIRKYESEIAMEATRSSAWRPLKSVFRRVTHPWATAWRAGRSNEWKILLAQAALAVRLGLTEEAMELLAPFICAPVRDAAYLNLLGVIFERRRDWRTARKLYGKAMRADRHFAPARQNMRRIYELYTWGKCREPLALGDETPGQWLALDDSWARLCKTSFSF